MDIEIPTTHLGLSETDAKALQGLSDKAKSFLYYATCSILQDVDRNTEANEKHKLLTNEQIVFYATIQSYGMVLNEMCFDSGVNKSLFNHFK